MEVHKERTRVGLVSLASCLEMRDTHLCMHQHQDAICHDTLESSRLPGGIGSGEGSIVRGKAHARERGRKMR